MTSIGRSVPRREGRAKVTGQAKYVDDVELPDMLFGATVRSGAARGLIKRIDFGPDIDWGDYTVVTAADVNARAGSLQPTILLDAPGAPLRPLAETDVRFVGDSIAVVVGESRYLAEDALAQGDRAAAISRFRRLLELMPPEAPLRATIEKRLRDIELPR